MARGQTQYYGLSQWEAADKVERVDFNSDNARVDGALHTLAEQAGRKADKSTVTNLSSVVSQKADETALSAAEGRISALESGKADKTELAAQIRALSQSHDADTEALRSENCWVKLGTAALAAEQAEMNFDLSGVDLSKFRALELSGALTYAENGTPGLQFNEGLHSFSGPNGRGVPYAALFESSRGFSGVARIYPNHYRDGGVSVLSIGHYYGYDSVMTSRATGSTDFQFVQIQSVLVSVFDEEGQPGTLAAGSSISLYGLKK